MANLFRLYIPLADTWQVIDNSTMGMSRRVAVGKRDAVAQILVHDAWQAIQRGLHDR